MLRNRSRDLVFLFLIGTGLGESAFAQTLPLASSGKVPQVAVSHAANVCTLDRATATTIDPKLFLTDGLSTRWNFATNLITFMRASADGYYRIFTIRPDGTDQREITENTPGLPRKHQGAPYWHPSGKYIFLIAQKEQYTSPKLFGNPDYEALPGFGRHDDLWVITADGRQAWQLTYEANAVDEGVLLPVVSTDGRQVAWSKRLPGGKYALMVANFVETPQPHLENPKSFQPGGAVYYEPGSFTSDNRSLMYSSDQDTHNFWLSQIYRLDLSTGQGVRLTQGNFYNEHPVVVATPSGDWVVYMSAYGAQRRPGRLTLGTDWYAMRPDGSGTKRLTKMNLNAKSDPENAGYPQVATTVAISPSGDFMLGDVQTKLAKQNGMSLFVRLVCAAGAGQTANNTSRPAGRSPTRGIHPRI